MNSRGTAYHPVNSAIIANNADRNGQYVLAALAANAIVVITSQTSLNQIMPWTPSAIAVGTLIAIQFIPTTGRPLLEEFRLDIHNSQ